VKTETTGKKDVSYTFAKNIVTTQFRDIPAAVVEHTKEDILDTIAVTLAGSSYKGTEPLLELIREFGGKEQSTILVFGDKVPCVNAALVNGSMSDSQDFSDAYGRGLMHAGLATIPPALAISERKGKVNGQDLITAVALGQDMALRMFLAMELSPGFHPAGIDNYFGATATVGKLLELDEEQMINAFGIAYSQISGTTQMYFDCVNTKTLQAGLASSAGVLSALLARKGLTGTRNTFEGKGGFCPTYCQGKWDLEQLTGNLGREFEGLNVGFKPYPSGMCEHNIIDAYFALNKEHNIDANDIAEVNIRISSAGMELFGEATEAKMKPKTVCDALFSGRYIAACAIVDGKVDLSCFTEDAIKRPKILKLVQRINMEADLNIDREIAGYPPKVTPAQVSIKLKGEKVYEKRVNIAKGNPKKPMTIEELRDKFHHCAYYAAKPLDKGNVDKAVDLIERLEEVDDVSEIMGLLVSLPS